jgi:endonuclease III
MFKIDKQQINKLMKNIGYHLKKSRNLLEDEL